MDKWEYVAPYFYLDEDLQDSRGKKYTDWVCDFGNGKRIEGIIPILDSYGKQGWELVNVAIAFQTSSVRAYRAFFKRKLHE